MWYTEKNIKSGEIMNNKERIYAVSECLLGVNCKYNGGNNLSPSVVAFLKDKKYVTVCPETCGGLPCPRDPSEIVSKDGQIKVISRGGEDVTGQFILGAEICAEKIRLAGVTHAILKARSPSCGVGKIYDGTFSGTVTDGNGIAADMFMKMGVVCVTEEEIPCGE